jgi:hypothetical protein
MLVLDDEILTPETGAGSGEPYDGVLGADVLGSFDLLISAPAGELVVYAPGTGAEPVNADLAPELPFVEARGHLISHKVPVNGIEATAFLDSGSRRLVLNGTVEHMAGIVADSGSQQTLSPGVGSRPTSIQTGTLRRLTVGRTDFEDLPVDLANLPGFSTLGQSDRPAVLLGVPLLRRCPVFISYETRTLRYCRVGQ